MFFIIDIIINLFVSPRFLLCSVMGFILFYVMSSVLKETDWGNAVGFILALIFIAMGAVWEFRADKNSK